MYYYGLSAPLGTAVEARDVYGLHVIDLLS